MTYPSWIKTLQPGDKWFCPNFRLIGVCVSNENGELHWQWLKPTGGVFMRCQRKHEDFEYAVWHPYSRLVAELL